MINNVLIALKLVVLSDTIMPTTNKIDTVVGAGILKNFKTLSYLSIK